MIFIWVDGQFYGCKTGFAEKYNEALKKKPILDFAEKMNIISNYNKILTDVNEKVLCSDEAFQKMNAKQKSYIVFVQVEDDFVICRNARMDMCLCYQVDV